MKIHRNIGDKIRRNDYLFDKDMIFLKYIKIKNGFSWTINTTKH